MRQGTVNPTSYNVIKDTSGLEPKHIQQLTYKLTHLYYNWPGTVRVPAPCQYALKLAFLVSIEVSLSFRIVVESLDCHLNWSPQVGESLHKEPSVELQDTLYYL